MDTSEMFGEWGIIFVDKFMFINAFGGLVILVLKDMKDAFKWDFGFMHSKNVVVRYVSVIFLTAYILLFGSLNGGQFIYFQF